MSSEHHSETPARVTEQSFVTLHYRIALASTGEDLVSTFSEKPATLQMGCGQLAEGIERCLLGMQGGDRRVFELSADQAYGPHNPAMVQKVSKKLIDQYAEADTTFEPGDFVEFPAPNGGRYAGTVKAVDENQAVVVDFNHPLAGQPVVFEASIIGVL